MTNGPFDLFHLRAGRFTFALKALALLPHRWYFALVRRLTGSDRDAVAMARNAP